MGPSLLKPSWLCKLTHIPLGKAVVPMIIIMKKFRSWTDNVKHSLILWRSSLEGFGICCGCVCQSPTKCSELLNICRITSFSALRHGRNLFLLLLSSLLGPEANDIFIMFEFSSANNWPPASSEELRICLCFQKTLSTFGLIWIMWLLPGISYSIGLNWVI